MVGAKTGLRCFVRCRKYLVNSIRMLTLGLKLDLGFETSVYCKAFIHIYP
jgi:hypothetical protein